ncbi:MAG: phosphate ABC transporter substrate-binding protein PstS [Verrucomicrobia bacterium RIFCSPHIGHO2_12_FULL_41_10]|nr:MAG: phosphate ABC transporter substrate-binding protein PstS [Verrucomicrobia bacterium RIFCSPHIGHO2_12_FULL_41_10]
MITSPSDHLIQILHPKEAGSERLLTRPFCTLIILVTTVIALAMTVVTTSATTLVNGSGATFPAPLYQRWAADFHQEHPDIVVNYQGVGSGAGVSDFIRGLTDFCASDVAVKDEEIARLHGNVLMIPVTAGTIVLSYNIPGITQLKLNRDAYVGIFLGKITQWNDPAIAKSNPGITFPDLPITVVTRSDGSGTTALFTGHLMTISSEFSDKVGFGKSVKWPTGLSGKGNDGVTALIKRTRGSIGYMEFGFAQSTHLPMAELENKAGAFVAPSDATGSLTLATIVLPENLRDFSFDPIGQGTYPITGFTWLLLKKEYPAEKSAAIKAFVTYALTKGQVVAPQLGYLSLPSPVVEKAQKALNGVK